MRILAMVVWVALASYRAAIAQLPAQEWRPSITEDNKAATWEDTAAFIVGALTHNGHAPQIVSKCMLTLSSVSPSSVFGLTLQAVPPASGVRIVAVAPGSFAEQIGLKPGQVIREINRKLIHGESDVVSIESQARIGDDFVFAIGGNHKGSFDSFVGGTLKPQSTDSLTDATVQFSKVDPLSITVRGNEITMGGTNMLPFVEGPTQGLYDEGRKLVVSTAADSELARRVARAFLHAALLCGGTKAVSPF